MNYFAEVPSCDCPVQFTARRGGVLCEKKWRLRELAGKCSVGELSAVCSLVGGAFLSLSCKGCFSGVLREEKCMG